MFFLMNSIPSVNAQRQSLWERAREEQAKLAEHYDPQPPRPYEDSTADKVIQFGLPLAGLLGAGTVGAGINAGKRAIGAVSGALSKPLKSTLARTTANAKSVADASQHAVERARPRPSSGSRIYQLQPDGTSQVIQGKKPTPGVEKRRAAREQAHAQQQAQNPTAPPAQPPPQAPASPPAQTAPQPPAPAGQSIPPAAQAPSNAPYLPPPSLPTPPSSPAHGALPPKAPPHLPPPPVPSSASPTSPVSAPVSAPAATVATPPSTPSLPKPFQAVTQTAEHPSFTTTKSLPAHTPQATTQNLPASQGTPTKPLPASTPKTTTQPYGSPALQTQLSTGASPTSLPPTTQAKNQLSTQQTPPKSSSSKAPASHPAFPHTGGQTSTPVAQHPPTSNTLNAVNTHPQANANTQPNQTVHAQHADTIPDAVSFNLQSARHAQNTVPDLQSTVNAKQTAALPATPQHTRPIIPPLQSLAAQAQQAIDNNPQNTAKSLLVKKSSVDLSKTADWKSSISNAASSWASKFKNSFGRNAAGAAKTIPSANVQKPISQMAHGSSPTPMGGIPSASQQMPMAPRAGKPLREPQAFGQPANQTAPSIPQAQQQLTQSYNNIPTSPKAPQAQQHTQQQTAQYAPKQQQQQQVKDFSPQAFAPTQQHQAAKPTPSHSFTPPQPFRQSQPSHSQGVANLVQQNMAQRGTGQPTLPNLSATSNIPQSARENMDFVRNQVQQNQHIDPQMRQALANAPKAHIPAHLQDTNPAFQARGQRQSNLPQTQPGMEAVQPPPQSFRDAQEFVRRQVGQNPVIDHAAKQQFGIHPHGTPGSQIQHGGTSYETPSALASKPYPAGELRRADYDAGKAHFKPNRERSPLQHPPAPGSHWDSTVDQRRTMYDANDYMAQQKQKAYDARLRQAAMPIPAHQVAPPYHGVQTPQHLQKTSSALSIPSVGMPKAPAMPSVKLPKITQQAAPRSVDVPKPLSLTQQPSPMDRVTPEIASASAKTAALLEKAAKYFGNGFGVTRHYDSSIASAPIPQSYQNRPTGFAAEGWDDSKPMQRHSAVIANGGSKLMDFAGRPNPLDMGGLQFNEVFLSAPAANAPKAPDPLIQMMQSQQQQQGMGQEQGDPSNPEVQQQQSADQQQVPAETESSMGGAEQAKISHAKQASGESIGGNIQELVGLGVLGVPAAYELIHGHPKPEDEQSVFHRTMQSPTTKSLAEILGLGILAQPYATNLYHQLTAPKVASPKVASWGSAALGAGAGLAGGLIAGSQAAHEDEHGNLIGPSASSLIMPTIVGGAAGYGLGKLNQHRNQPHLDALSKEQKILSGVEHRYRQTYPKMVGKETQTDIHFSDPVNKLYHDHELDHLRGFSRKFEAPAADNKLHKVITVNHPEYKHTPQSKIVFTPEELSGLHQSNQAQKENPYKRNWFSTPGALVAGVGTGALVNRMKGGQEITMTKEEMDKEAAARNLREYKKENEVESKRRTRLGDALESILDRFEDHKHESRSGRRSDFLVKLQLDHNLEAGEAHLVDNFLQKSRSRSDFIHYLKSIRGDSNRGATTKPTPAKAQKDSIPSAAEQPQAQPQASEPQQVQPPSEPPAAKQPTPQVPPPPQSSQSHGVQSIPPAPGSQGIRLEQNAHTNPPGDDMLAAMLSNGSKPVSPPNASTPMSPPEGAAPISLPPASHSIPAPSKPVSSPAGATQQESLDDFLREAVKEPAKIQRTSMKMIPPATTQSQSPVPQSPVPQTSTPQSPATNQPTPPKTPATAQPSAGSPFHYGYHAALPAALGAAYGTARGYLNPAVRDDQSEVNPLALGLGTAATTSLGGIAGHQLGNLMHYPNAGAAIGSILGGLGGHEALRRLM